jgi:hypothetical protein
LPVTPVALVARIFSDHGSRSEVSEQEIIAAIEHYRREWADRVWLMRERSASDIWRAAREILVLRHLIEVVVGGWRWNGKEAILRDYYANSLLSFEEVKKRGWPERNRESQAIDVGHHAPLTAGRVQPNP